MKERDYIKVINNLSRQKKKLEGEPESALLKLAIFNINESILKIEKYLDIESNNIKS